MKRTWTAGTRGSRLALRQTEIVLDRMRREHPLLRFETKVIRTRGDTIWDRPLHLVGGKGLFVKEIEEALLAGQIDFAVHSVKDLPTDLDEGLALSCVLEREDPRDVFLSVTWPRLTEVPPGGRIGTSSLRRKAQILDYRPGLTVVPLRGNVDTRVRKLGTEGLDGIILAAAGVIRMGLAGHIREHLPVTVMVPPSGQGAIGIETRADEVSLSLFEPINDRKSFDEVAAERRLQALIGGGCQVPLGIHASAQDSSMVIDVLLATEDGTVLFRDHRVIDPSRLALELGALAVEVRMAQPPAAK